MVEITNLVANYGMTVIVCGLFVWQYMRQQKYNEVREENCTASLMLCQNCYQKSETMCRRFYIL